MMTDEVKRCEEVKKSKKPFKLWFAKGNLPGRSNIQIGRPLYLPATVAGKLGKNVEINEENIERYLHKLIVKGPREKFDKPITENQSYGWYHDVRLTDADRSDRRLFHHKNTDTIVEEHLMNYAKIR